MREHALTGGKLIDREAGDDVVVPVLMRQSSFERLISNERVPVEDAQIGLVPSQSEDGAAVYTFVVWSGDPVWRGVPEQIPANEESAEALRQETPSP